LGFYFPVDWVVCCRGHKIFWLVPPTDKNLLLYEQWVKEQTDRTEFFGDLAEGCCRIEILAGKEAQSYEFKRLSHEMNNFLEDLL
jgi:hypothetical protein